MPLNSWRPHIHSRVGTTAIALFALAFIGWFALPHSLWSMIQPLARAASFTVNSIGDTSDAAPGNGVCADSSSNCTLRAALQEANSLLGDDTIDFSATGTIDLNNALPNIASNVVIKGPGANSLTIRRSTAGGTPNFRIFTTNSGTVITISGLTVTNGRTADGLPGASFGGLGDSGGGILNNGALTLTDVVVTGNRTGDGGTGGSSTGGFGGFGGGIASSGPLTMTNTTVSNNTAGNGAVGFFGGSGGRGGGIYFSGSALTMTNCSVIGNTAGNGIGGTSGGSSGTGGDGGGINAEKGPLNLTNVIISGNHAGDGAQTISSSGGNGGGMLTFPGVVTTMTNCTVSNNNTGQGGTGFSPQGGSGGGIDNFGPMTMIGCTVSGNFTKGPSAGGGSSGGGIFNNNLLTMIDCTISGNRTDLDRGRGGGIYNNGATVSLTNCTVTENSAISCCGFENGQGIHNGGTANIRNSIIAGNGNGSTPDVTGDFNSHGHNLIGKATIGDQTGFVNGNNGDQVGTPASPLNALLGPLVNNGGATLTHALLSNSPAFDAGDNCVTQPAHCSDANIPQLTTDQRGAGRLADSPDADTTATVDIGAFEFHQILENVQDRTTNEDTPLSVSFAIGDRGLETTTPTATSNNQALIPAANLSLTGTGSVRTLLITPIANLSGLAQITLSVTYTDSVSSGASPPQFVVEDTFLVTVNPVNDVPTFTLGPDQAVDPDVVFANQTVLEDAGPQSLANWATGISAGPNESEQTLTFQVTANTNPTLFSAGPAVSDTGTLTFTPAANSSGSALITVVLKDNGGTSNGGQDTSAAETFQITVIPINDVPTFTKGADQTVNEDAGFQSVPNWATGISAGPNESSQFAFFQVTGNTNPTLFGSAPSVNSLGTLTYSPASNASGSATITIVLRDTGGTTNGGQDTSASQTFNINVTAVNDAPINSVPFSQIINQNTSRVFSPANFNTISVTDVDAGTDAVRLTLTATQGTLTLGSTAGIGLETGDGTDDVTMTFIGPITAINTALNGLTFKPNTNFSGSASIQVTTDDLGHKGSGGAKSDTDTVAITVRAGGAIQFVNATYEVHENFGVATITVSRSGGSSGAGSVNYATSNGTAIGGPTCGSGGTDYRSASGTLSWANVDSSTKSFDVLFCGDSQNEANETINLVLSSPTGTVTLGTTESATLTILNDDAPVLLTVENTERVLGLDLVTQMTEPFSLTSLHNLSTDKRGRISIFVWRLGLLFGDTAANVTVLAEDDQGGVYNLPVESVVALASPPDLTQVVVRLPDNLIGAPRDLWVSVSLRGPGSNKALIRIASP